MAKANFLAAVGLMTSTEFVGGLLSGTLGLHKKPPHMKTSLEQYRFEIGLKYLGRYYSNLLKKKPGILNVYRDVRCGLVHQYLPTHTTHIVAGKTGGHGILIKNGRFRIMVDDYIDELDAAANKLLAKIDVDDRIRRNCAKALAQIPPLK